MRERWCSRSRGGRSYDPQNVMKKRCGSAHRRRPPCRGSPRYANWTVSPPTAPSVGTWRRFRTFRAHIRSITRRRRTPPLVMDCNRANFDSGPSPRLSPNSKLASRAPRSWPKVASSWRPRWPISECTRGRGGAIELLTKAGAPKQLRNPSYRHVRLWYALADVYDRRGPHVGARAVRACRHRRADAYDAKGPPRGTRAGAPRKNRKRRTTPVSKKKVSRLVHRRDDRPHRNFVPRVSSSLSFISIIA